ncbi:hypothetical protein KAFR_0G03740 [Kazachstania africana CBS 2517]|uniref:SH3 domain-containing protein n=1 Tax=Kazachstania africana (strain ATCC 22294 / BCRC 22015 / CBS 2517 / CECT 1963 / NBRC 1671 / NRRL Y-8276) TaxID=1071382 RepID=H2AYF7_KAZAF|nr:hypothetical protein KAFR_0G03740 [Kazachstania africana CBS 2517]CCF59407.1 hypothetical protein KAFR_0G03740 [Kazachstania africana CBS 2517]
MSSALINRAITNIKTELDFLRESEIITQQQLDEILKQLPEKYDPSSKQAQSNEKLPLQTVNAAANSSSASVDHASATPPPANQLEYVEALYAFEPQQEGDLRLVAGDKVQILEKPSAEWYKGTCNGQIGMFPANYVKPVTKDSFAPPPPQYQQYSNNYQQPSYSQPAYPPASTGYYQQPQQVQVQQPQQVQVQQQPQQQSQTNEQLKRFGSKLGNAAIFGAGATLGSDLVNSIF